MTQDCVAKVDKLKSNSVFEKKCNLYKIVVLKAFVSATSITTRDSIR